MKISKAVFLICGLILKSRIRVKGKVPVFYKSAVKLYDITESKSGGARIITQVMVSDKTVYLRSNNDKVEEENLTFALLFTNMP